MGWKAIAANIGDFQARFFLTIFYLALALPFGLLLRAFGDPLRLRRRGITSAWMPRARRPETLRDVRRQY